MRLRRFIADGLRRGGRCVVLGVVLVASLYALPSPGVVWYVGHRPQWVIWIDGHEGLVIGPNYAPWDFGVVPIYVGQLLLVSLPPWLVYRYVRSRRGGGRG